LAPHGRGVHCCTDIAFNRDAAIKILPDVCAQARRPHVALPARSAGLDDGKMVALDVQSGDRILFGKYSGNEITLDGTEYIIMREDDVLGVLDSAAQSLSKAS